MEDRDFYRQVDEVKEQGFTILHPALTSAECDEARSELDRLVRDRDCGGLELIFNKARIFERFYRIDALLRLVRHFLGADALLSSMHGSVLAPGEGGGEGSLHADGAITGHNRELSMSAAVSPVMFWDSTPSGVSRSSRRPTEPLNWSRDLISTRDWIGPTTHSSGRSSPRRHEDR